MDQTLNGPKPTIASSIEWGDTFQMLSWWKQEDVRNAKIMVAGAGALGNEVLKNLALLGVGNILIVDFDRIEYHNLSRSILFREEDSQFNRPKADVAAARMREINPEVKVKTINGDITIDVGLGVFRRMHVIIGCLDNRLARLYLNKYSFWVNKIWIDGAIQDLMAMYRVYKPGVTCYESGLSDTDRKIIGDRMGCADVAMRNFSAGRVPTTPLSASIIGALQVQEALKVVHGYEDKLLLGKSFYLEGMHNEIMYHDLAAPSSDAESSMIYDPVIEATELSANSTVAETLQWARGHFGDENPVIELHNRVITGFVPRSKEERVPVLKAFFHLKADVVAPYLNYPDEEVLIPKTDIWQDVGEDFPHQDARLLDLGIPYLHIIRIFANNKTHYVELTKDESFLDFE